MIPPLVARNLRHQGKLLVALAVALTAFEVFLVVVASSFEGGAAGLGEILQLLPDLLQRLINTQISQLAELSFPVFVAFGFQHPGVLVSAIAFAIVAGTLPAGDRDMGTLELFVARPISRARYLRAALASVVLAAVVFPVAVLVGGIIGLALVEQASELPWSGYVGCALVFGLLLLAVGGISLAVASGAPRRGTAVAQVAGLLVPLFLLESLAELSPALATVRWLSPFHYFNPIPAVLSPPVSWVDVTVLLAIFAVTTWIAFVRFARRDI